MSRRHDHAKSRLRSIASHLTRPGIRPSSSHSRSPSRSRSHSPQISRHELSPTYFLPRAASIEPHAEAIVHTTATGHLIRRTYKDFSSRAAGLAWWLKKHGHIRVGLLAPNTPGYLEGVFGIGGAGAVQVGINYRLKPGDIDYIFTHAEVDCIIVDKEFLHLLDGFNPSVRRIVDDDDDVGKGEFEECIVEGWKWDRKVNGGEGLGWEGLQLEPENEDELLALAYTSGTTAKPKGVEYTHRGAYLACLGNIIESNLNIQSVLTNERAKYLCTLPFFHATGWTVYWSVISVRGTHYTLRRLSYPHIWHLLLTEGITHFAAAPTVNTLLCADRNAARLPSPVSVTVAASPPSAKLFEDMISLNLHPVHVYGMTETYGPITKGYFMPEWHGLAKEEMYSKMARQGHGFITSRGVRVVKVNPDSSSSPSTLEDVSRNGLEIGEVVFSGNICTPRYHKDPPATSSLFSGGALRSGDLAVWHPDGSIQILDRAKDIIISGGENISSVALEGMLAKHPAVLEVAVVGVRDTVFGERPRAYVTGEEVVSWAKKGGGGISGFMVPREVVLVGELPKTSTGKVRKNVLREWAAEDDKVTPV
ncbi:acetyl-CoA synthetase-like protein [Terfezia boudieri ATCC MYA-4762]|uniref:Acetyl-CoA synthetase-like protein n=1 Tax=Terfezia boudieri ATCC MYA-4762 TaxID=1051890 RepID=A0A3N4M1E6_9PEZI|nr:acetyl-CoA synthetase-like protein [Terfezia boudieri ATCC MYA-4762]